MAETPLINTSRCVTRTSSFNSIESPGGSRRGLEPPNSGEGSKRTAEGSDFEGSERERLCEGQVCVKTEHLFDFHISYGFESKSTMSAKHPEFVKILYSCCPSISISNSIYQ